MLKAKSYVAAKRSPVGVAWKFGEGVPAQLSPSDRGSKLQDPSQTSPHVASKREFGSPDKAKLSKRSLRWERNMNFSIAVNMLSDGKPLVF
ncbi:hypothetical protein AVEN_126099-1 [Araneus ventricosus]|uniref:Uncharacterized protein n=1 Tax=Araneus ventricosus TaxID=182803 RepID=A0A4Y2CKJ4_ARAVE|nr:hypothetical protein AVEN_126099-1 [Araneus ventricosus]